MKRQISGKGRLKSACTHEIPVYTCTLIDGWVNKKIHSQREETNNAISCLFTDKSYEPTHAVAQNEKHSHVCVKT